MSELKLPAVYPLKHPVTITIGAEVREIRELSLRRPRGADMLLLDEHQASPMRLIVEMIAALSGEIYSVILKLDAEDIGPLGELAFANFDSGPPTGGTGSAISR